MSRRSYGSGSLQVRVDGNGVETWYGSWRVAERKIKRRLGRKRPSGTTDGLTKRQAERELRRRMAEQVPSAANGRSLFRQAAAEHLAHLETVLGRKPTTLQDYRIILRRHLYPAFGDLPLDRITADAISAYVAAKRGDGLASNTVRNHFNLLHGILRRAVRRGHLASNPAEQVDRPPAHNTRSDRLQFLMPDEVDRLLEAVPADPLGQVECPLYLTATITGLRQGELLALRWADVDLGAGRVRVAENLARGSIATPKSRSSVRSVPLAPRVAGVLAEHLAATGYSARTDFVFAHPDTGHTLDPSKLRKRFAKALARAGLPSIRFHDLRHTFGTQMAAAGAPLRAIQEWMGHSDPSTTAIYAHYAPDPINTPALFERAFDPSLRSCTA